MDFRYTLVEKKIKYYLLLIIILQFKFNKLCFAESDNKTETPKILEGEDIKENLKVTPYGGFSMSGMINFSNQPSLGYGSKYTSEAKFYIGTKTTFNIGCIMKKYYFPATVDLAIGIKLKNIGIENKLKPYVKKGYLSFYDFKLGYDDSVFNNSETVLQFNHSKKLTYWLTNTFSIESTNNGYYFEKNILEAKPDEKYNDINIKNWSCIALVEKVSFKTRIYSNSIGGLYKGIAYYGYKESKLKYVPAGGVIIENEFKVIPNYTTIYLDFIFGKGIGKYIKDDRGIISSIESNTKFENTKNKKGNIYIKDINLLYSSKIRCGIKQYVIPKRIFLKLNYYYSTCGSDFSKIFNQYKKLDYTKNKSNGWAKIHNLGLNWTFDLCKKEKRLRLEFDVSSGLNEKEILQAGIALKVGL